MNRKTILPAIALTCIIGIYALLALYRLGWADPTPDEGRYGLVATNIVSDYHQLAILSEDPLGHAGTKPFMYGASLAPFVLALGRSAFALRLCSVLALLGAGLLTFGLVNTYFKDRVLSVVTLFFFLVNPWTISYARSAMPETVLVFWGCLALFAAVRTSTDLSLPLAIVTGLALGCSFLTKLWLCGPFLLTCLVIFIGTLKVGPRHRVLVAGLLGACTAGFAAISHILLVLWLTPRDLDHWLNIYFIVSFAGRTSGTDYDPAMWIRPWWFYSASFFKAVFFGLPLLLLGAYSLLRKRDRIVTAALVAMLLPLPVLSLFAVKQTSYIYPIFPAAAFILAYGCVVALRSVSRRMILVAIGISMLMLLPLYECQALGSREAVGIFLLYSFYAVIMLTTRRIGLISGSLLATGAFAALLVASIVAVRNSLDHRTYYRELADYFRPVVAHTPPQKVIFVAPEFTALEFYLFRTGQYWQTFYFHEDYAQFLERLKRGELAFYVVDPNDRYYGGKVSAQKLNALHQYATDETSAIVRSIGKEIPFRVFIPRGQKKDASSGFAE